MNNILHITSGDCAGDVLKKTNISGEIFVWHDIMYDGPRQPGWPDNNILNARAEFLEEFTLGGLKKKVILETLENQYKKIDSAAENYDKIVLWFDGCLFDQSMLVHILTCLHFKKFKNAELLCVDKFPEIIPYNGLGQLNPAQLENLYSQRKLVTEAQFQFAKIADAAFANQNFTKLAELSHEIDAPLPCVPAAAARWILEQPNPATGLGRLEFLALEAIRNGCKTPLEIFKEVAANDTLPQYWGDTTLWAKINGLVNRNPPLIKINGPAERLPQWESALDLQLFRIEIL